MATLEIIAALGFSALLPRNIASCRRKYDAIVSGSGGQSVLLPRLLLLFAYLITFALMFTYLRSLAAAAAVAHAFVLLWVVDRRSQIIPDRVHLIGCAALLWLYFIGRGKISLASTEAWIGFSLAPLLWLLTAVYERLRGRTGMGMGDVKLLAWTGLLLGPAIYPATLVAALLGVIFSIGAGHFRRDRRHTAFAFGPFIVLGVLVTTVATTYKIP